MLRDVVGVQRHEPSARGSTLARRQGFPHEVDVGSQELPKISTATKTWSFVRRLVRLMLLLMSSQNFVQRILSNVPNAHY